VKLVVILIDCFMRDKIYLIVKLILTCFLIFRFIIVKYSIYF